MGELRNHFGWHLRHAWTRLGVKKREFCARAGITLPTLGRYEKCPTPPRMNLGVMERLAKVLGYPSAEAYDHAWRNEPVPEPRFQEDRTKHPLTHIKLSLPRDLAKRLVAMSAAHNITPAALIEQAIDLWEREQAPAKSLPGLFGAQSGQVIRQHRGAEGPDEPPRDTRALPPQRRTGPRLRAGRKEGS